MIEYRRIVATVLQINLMMINNFAFIVSKYQLLFVILLLVMILFISSLSVKNIDDTFFISFTVYNPWRIEINKM